MKRLRLLICVLLMGGVLVQSIHSSYDMPFLESTELTDHRDLDDLDKKEKESNEKFSQVRIFWELMEIEFKSGKKTELKQPNYPLYFLDSKDNPPELS